MTPQEEYRKLLETKLKEVMSKAEALKAQSRQADARVRLHLQGQPADLKIAFEEASAKFKDAD